MKLQYFKRALEQYRKGNEVTLSTLWGDTVAQSEQAINDWFGEFEAETDFIEVLYDNEYGMGLYATTED